MATPRHTPRPKPRPKPPTPKPGVGKAAYARRKAAEAAEAAARQAMREGPTVPSLATLFFREHPQHPRAQDRQTHPTRELPWQLVPPDERYRRLHPQIAPLPRRAPATRPLPGSRAWYARQPTQALAGARPAIPRKPSFWVKLFQGNTGGVRTGKGHLKSVPELLTEREQRAAKIRQRRALTKNRPPVIAAQNTAIIGRENWKALVQKNREPIGSRSYILTPEERRIDRIEGAPTHILPQLPARASETKPLTPPRRRPRYPVSLSARARLSRAAPSFETQMAGAQAGEAAARLRNAEAFRDEQRRRAEENTARFINDLGLDALQRRHQVSEQPTEPLAIFDYPTGPTAASQGQRTLSQRARKVYDTIILPAPTIPPATLPPVARGPQAQRLSPGMLPYPIFPAPSTMPSGPLTSGGTRNPFFAPAAPGGPKPGAPARPVKPSSPAALAPTLTMPAIPAAGAGKGARKPPAGAGAAANQPAPKPGQRANQLARALGSFYLPQSTLRSPIDAVVEWLANVGTPGGLLLPLTGLMLFTSAVAPVGPKGETRFELMYKAVWGRVIVPPTPADLAEAVIAAEKIPVLQREIAGVLGAGIATGLANASALAGQTAGNVAGGAATGAAIPGLQPWLDPIEQLWSTTAGVFGP